MAKIFSSEDGALSTSIRVVKERVYSDLDLSFFARTDTDGDVYKKTDAAAVKQAVKTLILTNFFEKPYRPQFGANLRSLLFELMDENTGDEIISNIKTAIERWEPRVKILNLKVTATPDYNLVSVTLEFRVVSTSEVVTLRVPLDEPSTSSLTSLPVTQPVPPPPISDVVFEYLFINPPSFYDSASSEEYKYFTVGTNYLKRDIGSVDSCAILTAPDGDEIFTQSSLTLIVNQCSNP